MITTRVGSGRGTPAASNICWKVGITKMSSVMTARPATVKITAG